MVYSIAAAWGDDGIREEPTVQHMLSEMEMGSGYSDKGINGEH